MYEPEGVINVGKIALFNGILIDFLIIVNAIYMSILILDSFNVFA